MGKLEVTQLTTRQDSDFEPQNQLTHLVLTYFAAIDDKQLSLSLTRVSFLKRAP